MVFHPQAHQDSQIGFHAQRRYLVLYLPYWATDYLKWREPSLEAPLALYERIKGALRLVALDREALRLGLRPGQTLADARALQPRLVVREIDRPMIAAGFADFADWHSNASPLVAVLSDMGPFGDLVLDITGVDHLFGGEQAMLERLVTRLRQLGFSVDGGIASTIGAAWATSHFTPNRVVPATGLARMLAPLPVAALRLAPDQIAGLRLMGLKHIGQLQSRDRKALAARFGASLVERFDQAHGFAEERLVPRLPIARRYAERRFPDPIGLMDDVLMCARDLAIQLALRLEAEGLGARTFRLFLYRVDHKVMTLAVRAARPIRDAEHIARLFVHHAERLAGDYDAGFGIDMVRLDADMVSPLASTQITAFGTRDGVEDLDRLYDRMASRLGSHAVLRPILVDSHIPERAARLEPVLAQTAQKPGPVALPEGSRPLRLLPVPEPITVTAEVPDGPPAAMVWRRVSYKFVKAAGAERIGAEWWRTGKRLQLVPPLGPEELAELRKKGEQPPYIPPLAVFDDSAETRDYHIAEDMSGRRFWLFRQGLYGAATPPAWYLHGFFS